MFQHAVLVDAALVGEGVPPDDGLVVLHREVRRRGDEFRGAGQHGGVDAGGERQHVAPGADRHDDLLERGVAGALADAVDGAFDLPRAALEPGQGVGDRKPEVVVAMDGEHGLVGVGHPLADGAENRPVLVGGGKADGVRQVDRRRSGPDRRLDAAAQVLGLGAGRVHRGPFHVLDQVAGLGDGRSDDLQHVLLRLAHLVSEMDRGRRDEGVNARPARPAHRLSGPGDVGADGTGEAGNGSVLDPLGNQRDRLEIAVRGNGKSGLDDVDAHRVQEIGDLDLFLEGHRRAGALLAVAQGGVEDQNTAGLAGHGGFFLLARRPFRWRRGSLVCCDP